MAAKDLILTAANKILLLARLEPTALQSGAFSSPDQKTTELKSILYDLVDGVESSG